MDTIDLEAEKLNYPVEECPGIWEKVVARIKSILNLVILNDPESKKGSWVYTKSDVTGKYLGGTKYEWKWNGAGPAPPGQWVRTVVKGHKDSKGCVTETRYGQGDSWVERSCNSYFYVPLKITYHFYGPNPENTPLTPDQLNGHEYYYKPNRGNADTWIRYTVFTNSKAMEKVKQLDALTKSFNYYKYSTPESNLVSTFYEEFVRLMEQGKDTTELIKKELGNLFKAYSERDCATVKDRKARDDAEKAAEEAKKYAEKLAEQQKKFREDWNNYTKSGYKQRGWSFENYSDKKDAERAAEQAKTPEERAKNAAEKAKKAAEEERMAPIKVRLLTEAPKTVEEFTGCLDTVKSIRAAAATPPAAATNEILRKRTRSNRSNRQRKSRRGQRLPRNRKGRKEKRF